MEKTINFKVDEEFYKEIKIEVAIEGITLKKYIIDSINFLSDEMYKKISTIDEILDSIYDLRVI